MLFRSEGNLKEDTRSDMSEEGEIPPKEKENLNKSAGEDKEMLLCGDLRGQ